MSSVSFSAAAFAATSTAVSAALLNLALAPLSTAALAAEDAQLEEVVVTAERRESDAQKTAASLTVRTGEDLLEQGKFSLQQILEDVPGVADARAATRAVGSDQAGNSIVIRGVQSNTQPSGTQISSSSATAVYVDDIYEGVGGNYDLARVEVLRGPQGTLYGRSATSGVVAIHTRNPELGRWGGNAAVEAGDYSLQHYTGALNVPLGEVWALRVAGNEYERDGYDSKEGGSVEVSEGRTKLLFKPNDSFSALLGFALQNNERHSGGVSVVMTAPHGDDYTYNSIPIAGGKTKFRQYWAKIDWDLGLGTLTYLPALRTWEQDSATSTVCCGGRLIYAPAVTPYDHFHTHELRLASNPGSKLTWQFGGMYYRNKLHNFNEVGYPLFGVIANRAETHKDTQDIGVFGEATYPLTDTLRITAGLRYDSARVQVNQVYTSNTNPALVPEQLATYVISGEQGKRNFSNLTYKGRIEYDLTPTSLVYATVASGFTPGDVQAGVGRDLRPTAMPYDDQILTAYEIGAKNRFLDNTLQVNADIFYYRYGGFQTAGVNVTGNPRTLGFATLVIPARMKGAELEIAYQLTKDDRLSLNYAYTSAWYVDMPTDFSNNVATDRPWNIPWRTGSAAYEHAFYLPGDSELTVRAAARYTGGSYAANNLPVTPAQMNAGAGPWIRASTEVVGDLSATWALAGGRYSIGGYVRNIADNRYKTYVGIQNVPSVDTTAIPYDPRTYGVVLNASF